MTFPAFFNNTPRQVTTTKAAHATTAATGLRSPTSPVKRLQEAKSLTRPERFKQINMGSSLAECNITGKNFFSNKVEPLVEKDY